MADPILFQAFPLHDWPWGGETGNLYIFNNRQWTDQNGVVQLANAEKDITGPRQRCPIVVTNRTPIVQDFFYQPTPLAIDYPNARRTGVVYDADDSEHYELFAGAVFPELPSPMNWTEFIRQHSTSCRAQLQHRYWDATQIENRIAQIQTISAGDLARLATARGFAQMAVDVVAMASQVVVPCVLVTENSIIKPYSQDANVSGSLGVPERTVGQDFTIRSNVVGDQGLVAWEVSEPF